MSGIQDLIAKKVREAEEFIERSLELAERFGQQTRTRPPRPEAEERFLLQAIRAERHLNEFKAGRRDWP